MAYSLSNKCAKNLCKRTVLVQVIIEDIVTCFLEHIVYNVTKCPSVRTRYNLVMCQSGGTHRQVHYCSPILLVSGGTKTLPKFQRNLPQLDVK